jgi:hypothetical protein
MLWDFKVGRPLAFYGQRATVRFVMNHSSEPKLAAPGAGLPTLELGIVRVVFGIRCTMGKPRILPRSFRQGVCGHSRADRKPAGLVLGKARVDR